MAILPINPEKVKKTALRTQRQICVSLKPSTYLTERSGFKCSLDWDNRHFTRTK